jgi:anti-sigma B factor antagonist
MILKPRKVTVELLPRKFGPDGGQTILFSLLDSMDAIRPCVVLDCSPLASMDHSAVSFLLCCLEEALKRNGDVRLSGVSPAAGVALQATGADRLFCIFVSQAEAVSSFQRPLLELAACEELQQEGDCTSESAA